MYVARFNAVDDEQEIRAMVSAIGSAELITIGPDGYPIASLVPVLWDGGTVIAHLARANPHWRAIGSVTPALFVCTGPQAYVSPSWYAAKAEHGRVVPTWNYSAVHLTGTAVIHDDVEWTRQAVTALTRRHEDQRPEPWAVSDAPAAYVDAQLKAIVGVEFTIERVEAKAKLSQNRSEGDRAGVVDGLSAEGTSGARQVAEQMRLGSPDPL